MQKEYRYVVFKLKDMEACFNARDYSMLDQLSCKLVDYRRNSGKSDLEAVVIESDWKCYGDAWSLVEKEYNEKYN